MTSPDTSGSSEADDRTDTAAVAAATSGDPADGASAPAASTWGDSAEVGTAETPDGAPAAVTEGALAPDVTPDDAGAPVVATAADDEARTASDDVDAPAAGPSDEASEPAPTDTSGVEVAAEADDDLPAPDSVFALPAATDEVCAEAVDLARAAALEVGGDTVGEHLGVRAEAERVVTHAFAATLQGYVGWHWAVTVARASRSRTVTVDEVVLLPGDGALRPPSWVPWDERVRPGDLSPGDLLPGREDDIRLVPAYTLSDDPAVEAVAFELGLGREHVMSREGREFAAERWVSGEHGPDAPMARQAPAHCGTCGFYLPLAGSLSAAFGVCGNEVTESDGQIVSVEFGCGAHSEVRAESTALAEVVGVVYDDGEEITVGR